MTATTFSTESTIYILAADLMAHAASDADRARIDRALDLVETVERTARPGVFLVCSASDGDRAYTVRDTQCNCADTPRERGATRCKHAWAVVLSNLLERAEVDAEQALTIRVDPEDSILDLWPLDGEPCDLPAQCPRCHTEETNRRHPDGLGNACISRELFGEEV